MNFNFFKTNYFLTLTSYGILMGSSIAIRVSFVFLLSIIFSLNDSQKFLIYTSFTTSSDLSSLLTSYISLKKIKEEFVSIFGFLLSFIGIIIFYFSLLKINLNLLYLSLVFISMGFGIIRSNLMSINSSYLNKEFSSNRKEYGSLIYFSTVFFSFIIVFFGGFLLKNNINLIASIIFILVILSFLIFYNSEKSKISNFLINIKGILSIFDFLKIIFFIILFFLSSYSLYLIGNNNILYILPLFLFIAFYIYLIYRAIKNNDERDSILLSISISILIIFFVMIERQRDTSIALFILRNMDYKYLSPIQINAIFSIFMLSINIIFFKIKIHTKSSLLKLYFIVPICILITFFILYLNCFYPNQYGKVSLFPYLISMIFMSIASVLVFAQYSYACSHAKENIRVLITGFMVISMGFGFYLTKFISKFMEINQIIKDPFYSLEIYKDGFLKICILCIIFILSFLILVKSNKKIQNFLSQK